VRFFVAALLSNDPPTAFLPSAGKQWQGGGDDYKNTYYWHIMVGNGV